MRMLIVFPLRWKFFRCIKVGTNLSIDGNGVLSSTDTNTTYSSGNGINLSGTEFTVSGGDGLTQEASGLKITPSQTTVTSILNSGLVVEEMRMIS